jgi:hypothetical protein
MTANRLAHRLLPAKRKRSLRAKEQVISSGISAPESQALFEETHHFCGFLWSLSDGSETARKWPNSPNHAGARARLEDAEYTL